MPRTDSGKVQDIGCLEFREAQKAAYLRNCRRTNHNKEPQPGRFYSLLQQPGPKKFKLSKIELIYKAKKFKVPPFTV